MKLSGYYKELGNDVELKLDYEDLQLYDKVFISKVFTDTPIDESVLNLPNVVYGGTGFSMTKHQNFRMKLNIICRIITYMMSGFSRD